MEVAFEGSGGSLALTAEEKDEIGVYGGLKLHLLSMGFAAPFAAVVACHLRWFLRLWRRKTWWRGRDGEELLAYSEEMHYASWALALDECRDG